MEEYEQEEKKPLRNWSGEERLHGANADWKGDERRKSAMTGIPGGDLTGGNPGIGDSEADEAEGR